MSLLLGTGGKADVVLKCGFLHQKNDIRRDPIEIASVIDLTTGTQHPLTSFVAATPQSGVAWPP